MLISPNKPGLGTQGHPGAVAGLPADGRRAEKMPGGQHRVKSGFSGRQGSDFRFLDIRPQDSSGSTHACPATWESHAYPHGTCQVPAAVRDMLLVVPYEQE